MGPNFHKVPYLFNDCYKIIRASSDDIKGLKVGRESKMKKSLGAVEMERPNGTKNVSRKQSHIKCVPFAWAWKIRNALEEMRVRTGVRMVLGRFVEADSQCLDEILKAILANVYLLLGRKRTFP